MKPAHRKVLTSPNTGMLLAKKGSSTRSVHPGAVGVGVGGGTSVESDPGRAPSSPSSFSVEPERFRGSSVKLSAASGSGTKGAGPGVRGGKPARPPALRSRAAARPGEEPAAASERGSPTRQALSGGEATTAPRGSRGSRGPPPSVRVRTCHRQAVRVHTVNRRARAAGSSLRKPAAVPPGARLQAGRARTGADRSGRWSRSGTSPSLLGSQSGGFTLLSR